jgi:microcystin degradation protein MlrC
VTLDLHAALTRRIERTCDIVCAYRTNPHRDHAATGRRAGRLLIDTLFSRVRPTVAWRSLPMVLGGGMTLDFLPPMRRIFAMMTALELWPRVLDVNLFMCHVWNDHPELGWGVHVTTNDDQGLAERVADLIAEAAWAVRHHGLPAAPMADEAIEEVKRLGWRRKLGTVCMSDVSDVVGAGAAGENTRLIESFLGSGEGLVVYAPIRDGVVVEDLWGRPIGSEVEVEVGGKLHAELNTPLPIRAKLGAMKELEGFGRVVRLDDVRRVGGETPGRPARLHLAVTEGPPLVMKPAFYRSLGLEPWLADVCVVKSFFPFRIYFLLENRKTIYARTRGVTDFEVIHDLELSDRVFPVSEVSDWREVDARRRARVD